MLALFFMRVRVSVCARSYLLFMNACADAGKQLAEARWGSSGFDAPVVEQASATVSGAGALALSLSSTEPTGTLVGPSVD